MDRYPTHQTNADSGDRHATPIEQQQEMVKRKTRRKQTAHYSLRMTISPQYLQMVVGRYEISVSQMTTDMFLLS